LEKKEKYKIIMDQLHEQEHMHSQLNFQNKDVARKRKQMRKDRKGESPFDKKNNKK
jgi:hypothetical protein